MRALSGHMSIPGPDHWKSMGRLISYMKQMKLRGVLHVQPESFKTLSLADTDYSNCKEHDAVLDVVSLLWVDV